VSRIATDERGGRPPSEFSRSSRRNSQSRILLGKAADPAGLHEWLLRRVGIWCASVNNAHRQTAASGHFLRQRACDRSRRIARTCAGESSMKTRDFLQQRRVPFEVVPHEETFDASRLAQAVHTPGRKVAKSVLLRADGGSQYIVAVLPSTHRVDLEGVSRALGGANVRLATEAEVSEHCPDCECGVLPPFGSQYAAETIVDTSLTDDDEIVFEGSTHCEAIRMKYRDYCRIEHPRVVPFAFRA
jgi:Ala-tRNA(Pro) deacylase